MHVHDDSYFQGRITTSHIYALNNGAMITTPLLLNPNQLAKLALKPGDEIEMESPELDQAHIRCRILDIESVNAESDNVYIRLTLEKVAMLINLGTLPLYLLA